MLLEGRLSLQKRKEKMDEILKRNKGNELVLGGFMGTDARVAKAAYDAGARIFEPNHPAMALQMGLGGATSMREAEKIRHLVPHERMIQAVKSIRSVLGDDVFITVATKGLFTEDIPTPFTFEDAYQLAIAGADCLHTHKSSLEDVKRVTDLAHSAGLMCEAYIDYDDYFGVQAKNNDDLVRVIKEFEEIGVDIIGIESGMIYQGVKSTELNEEFIERVQTFLDNVSVYTALEGGIKLGNMSQIKQLGFDLLVMSTAVDDEIQNTTHDIIKKSFKL